MSNLVKMVGGTRPESLLALLAECGFHDALMVEVGSYAGESADVFASCRLVSRMICVDPWQAGYDPKDPASYTDFSEVEAVFDTVMSRHSDKIEKYKGTLQQLVAERPDLCPDIVYIDANHSYEFVKADIGAAKKLNPKIIAGHDYDMGHTGVIRAVAEELGDPMRVFFDSSWYVRLRD